jgi:hypothetical protein
LDCTSIRVAESSTAAVEKLEMKPARMPPVISGTRCGAPCGLGGAEVLRRLLQRAEIC